MHGGGPKVVAGQPLDSAYTKENIPLLEAGFVNLKKHIENMCQFGVPVVVALNTFSSDSAAELELLQSLSKSAGAMDAVICNHWAKGGEGWSQWTGREGGGVEIAGQKCGYGDVGLVR